MKTEENGVDFISLTKKFGNVVAVDNISLCVEEGEFLTMLGPSGSGKTTTLMMIAGFELPTSGKIFIRGKDVMDVPPFERNIGMVFQNYALFPHMTVFDNIAFPLKMRKLSKNEISRRVKRVLEIVKLPGLEFRLPKQLSGGQQQRVALARAVVYDPPLLLMDEPLGALDKKLRDQMQVEIRNLQQELGITCLYVTHDQEEALTMSDRIVVFDNGKIQQVGRPDELYEKPKNHFVADFIGESNFLDGYITCVANDYTIVSVGDGNIEIQCPKTPGITEKKQVQLSIRPEKIRFVEPSSDIPAKMEGVIEKLTYSGEIRRYIVRVNSGDTINIKQQILHGVRSYKKGDRVFVGWSLEDAIIL